MENDKIIASKRDGIGSLVINNPEKRNAFSLDMSLAAAEVIEDFAADAGVRVIVVSGAGDKAFISGGDISKFEAARATPEQVAEYNRKSSRFRLLLRGVGKPTIAMIRGYCLGGGLAVALNCDLRICSEDAQFGIPAARLGIGYNAEGLTQLVRLVGPSTAKEILFTARRYNAQEALRVGLVNQVLPGVELADYVQKYAAAMVANAPLSIIAAKRVIDEIVKDRAERDTALCERVIAECFASQDYVEGRRAFMEKRKPAFTGR
ncbi:MAG: enoyl-CoA hydratase/isomerase family protein [Burkholderiales bacterium]|nr:enoyl-CoA hydratase/isomerase family protein [Burkholderiales bacterium]